MTLGMILIVSGCYFILITIQILLVRIDDKVDLIMKDLGIVRKSNIRKIINKLEDFSLKRKKEKRKKRLLKMVKGSDKE